MKQETKQYDVVIMGGGPGGATLASLIRRKTRLTVAVFESETFPREHIGESFSHRVIYPLVESGALEKVIWSGCAIKKFGGYYAWDLAEPSTTFFDHADYLQDGIKRWAMHVDRAQFDKVLLDHARSCGAHVFEGTKVKGYEHSEKGGVVTLESGAKVGCRIFVEASGRCNNLLANTKKKNLSKFKNMAIWTHLTGGKPGQSASGDWNIFRKENLSPIGCFAFEDGWFWYIPVPKSVNGSRVVCHSLGLVTNPDVLKEKGKEFLKYDDFINTARTVPLLKDLISDVSPLSEELHVATNYSMINEKITDFDKKGILLGDAAYFVDPLFSSGVAFALNQSLAACALIRDTLSGECEEIAVKELWEDYDFSLRRLAHTYALSIDQWYYAISQAFPKSTYWNQSRFSGGEDFRTNVFQSLVDTSLTPDLLQVLTKGTAKVSMVDSEGPIASIKEMILSAQPEDSKSIILNPSARYFESWTYRIPQLYPSTPQNGDEQEKVRLFWSNPEVNRDCVPEAYTSPEPCIKFQVNTSRGLQEVSVPRELGQKVAERLEQGPVTFKELLNELGNEARPYLVKMALCEIFTDEEEGQCSQHFRAAS